MSDPIFPLEVWQSGTNENSIPANDNALRMEAMSREVISKSTTAQPGSPSDGDVYIIPAAATGAQWSTFSIDDLTIYRGGTWYAFAPVTGMVVNVAGTMNEWAGSAGWTVMTGGGGVTDGDKGDITVSGSGATWTIDNDVVTYAKMQNVSAASRLIGRGDSGSGDPQEITVGSGLTMTGTTLSASGGGLTGFTSSLETAAPNNLVNVSRMLASGGTTDQDFSSEPKGAGANTSQTADSGTTGGNKRGVRATDWQKLRGAATNVASGAYSVLGGGRSNTASNNYSAVAGGIDNLCSGEYGSIGGGSANTCSGQYAHVGGGSACQATAQYSSTVGGNGNISSAVGASIGGGASNAANGQYSWIPGGNNATARSIYGVGARASGVFAAQGDSQSRCGTLRCSTTNATQTTLATDGGAASTSNQFVLPNTSAFIVKATVVSRENATGDSRSWEVTAHIKRGANAAATAMVAAATVTSIANDAGAAAWALAVDADTTNGCLRIRFTGEAAKTIRTVCDVYSCCEVVG